MRHWLKKLNYITSYPTVEERMHSKKSNLSLKSSFFGLIQENQLRELLCESSKKKGRKHTTPHPCDPQPKNGAYNSPVLIKLFSASS